MPIYTVEEHVKLYEYYINNNKTGVERISNIIYSNNRIRPNKYVCNTSQESRKRLINKKSLIFAFINENDTTAKVIIRLDIVHYTTCFSSGKELH